MYKKKVASYLCSDVYVIMISKIYLEEFQMMSILD